MMTFKKLIERLNSPEPLVIMGHIDPDADAVCSMLAVYKAFNGAEKDWQLVLQDAPPEYLEFLPEIDKIELLGNLQEPIQDLLLVDCNEMSRANKIGIDEADLQNLWVIDHHISSGELSDSKIIDPTSAACCELVFQIIKAAGIEIDADLALILYTGLVGDTGCFKQANTTAQTLSAAAELIATGFDTECVRINLFERKTAANIKLLGKALSDMESFYDDRLCFLTVCLTDKIAFNAGPDDCTSIVGHSLTLQGVKIGVFFEEREDNCVKISFRSRRGFDIRSIAEEFGGGGHLLAAGATVKGEIDTIKAQVKKAIERKFFI